MVLPPELYASIVFVLHMGDLFTTRYALTKLKGFGEANPLARYLLSAGGFPGLSAFKSAVAGAVLIAIGFLVGSEWIWLALVAVSSVPVIWNTYVIRKATGRGG